MIWTAEELQDIKDIAAKGKIQVMYSIVEKDGRTIGYIEFTGRRYRAVRNWNTAEDTRTFQHGFATADRARAFVAGQ